MTSKVAYRAFPNFFNTNVFEVLMAIPDGWVVSGRMTLPQEKKFNNRKIIRNGGIKFSRFHPWPMVVSNSQSQKERDNDLGLLLSFWDSVPGFEEWEQYGIDSAYSLHWTKVHISDRFNQGYAGTIEAVCPRDGNPELDPIARCVFNFPSRHIDSGLSLEASLPNLVTEYFPPLGSEDSVVEIHRYCQRNHWEKIEAQAA